MSIPRALDPETGPRVLPDYSRSADTIERMIRSLEPAAPVSEGKVSAPVSEGKASDEGGVVSVGSSAGAGTAVAATTPRGSTTTEPTATTHEAGPTATAHEAGPTASTATAPAAGPTSTAPAATEPTMVRALFPTHAIRDCALRAALSAVFLSLAFAFWAGAYVSWQKSVPAENAAGGFHAPGLGVLAVVTAFVLLAACASLQCARYVVLALAAARARVELWSHAARIVGAVGSRCVPWREVERVEARIVHPLHGVSSGLRLRNGRLAVMPAFDRSPWHRARTSGEGIATVRAVLAEHRARAGAVDRAKEG